MLVLEDYDLVRIAGNRLLVGSSNFTREEEREAFLESLERDGFKLRRENGKEVTLKALVTDLSYSIGGAEVLMIEIDSSLDESTLR